MAIAAANPSAVNYGTNLVGIVCEQSDYNTLQALPATPSATDLSTYGAWAHQVEFREPYSLTPVRQFYPVERLKGNPSPDPSIPGMLMGAGELHFYLDPGPASFWFKHLLQTDTVTSTAVGTHDNTLSTAITLAAGTSSAFGAWSSVAADDQPKAMINSTNFTATEVPEEMNASKVRLTFASSNADIEIEGKDHNGVTINEVFTSSSARTTETSTNYYKDGLRIRKKGTGTLSVTAIRYDLSGLYEHELSFVGTVGNGLSLEVQEGNSDTPISYQGLLVSRGIIRLEDVCRMSFQVIANRVFPRQALGGGTTATALTRFPGHPFNAVPNFGMLWEVDGTAVPTDMQGAYRVSQLGVAIDNRLAPPATAYADSLFYPKPVRKMNRELQIQAVIDHAAAVDFDQFVGGLTFESKVSTIVRDYGGPYRSVIIDMANAQLVANPVRQVQGVGEMTQAISMRANVGTTTGGNDEATVYVFNTDAAY